ncbi:hypothetical protein TNCV_3148261 [Trichonephila clavipes]|nr:hypothetical protein TNCV_3148261 [Trichonephila clavipes]
MVDSSLSNPYYYAKVKTSLTQFPLKLNAKLFSIPYRSVYEALGWNGLDCRENCLIIGEGVSAKMLQTSRRGRGQQDDSKYIGNAGSEMLS